MIKIPQSSWNQPNNSDKFGNLWYTKNINLDEEGYLKNSPRSVQIYDESQNSDFDVPVSFGRFDSGEYVVATTNTVFNAAYDDNSILFEENEGTNNPSGTSNSHGLIWQGRFHVSGNTTVVSKDLGSSAGQNWTSRITGLASGVRHYMALFSNRLEMVVTNGNEVKQYNTSYVNTTDLILPSDFEAVGVAYNNNQMGVITRLGSSTEGQNREAHFFTWDGETSEANGGWGVGSEASIALCAYKSSWLVLTKAGQLKYFNGGGFEEIAAFPFYFTDNIYGDLVNQRGRGDLMVVDGDTVLINLSLDLETFGKKEEMQLPQSPSGVWCFDPKVGLYHKYSPSISQAYAFDVTDANVDLSTNIFTVSSGTVPQTGSIARYTGATTVLGGLKINHDYHVIKLTSSTFKLAISAEAAKQGVAIDITSKGSGTNNFWMYDFIDYGQTFANEAGAISLIGETNMLNRGIIIGTDTLTTALTNNANVSIVVPELHSRGYFVTPKIFSPELKDTGKNIYIKHRILKEGDSIVVKARNKSIVGLPVTSPQVNASDEATWADFNVFTTGSDLSDAKTALDNGNELELEIVAGAGAGTLVKITSITESFGTYTVTLAEDVIGTSLGLKSHFIIDHWQVLKTLDSNSTTNSEGYGQIPIGKAGSWIQFKIELRGVEVAIEELQIISTPQIPSA